MFHNAKLEVLVITRMMSLGLLRDCFNAKTSCATLNATMLQRWTGDIELLKYNFNLIETVIMLYR